MRLAVAIDVAALFPDLVEKLDLARILPALRLNGSSAKA